MIEDVSAADLRPGTKAGTVVLIGRPNAGKSTLMNHCLAEKLAIVSDKPQTTRHRLIGILSQDQGQMVFFDTPGVHKPHRRMNRQMVRYAVDALNEADVVCLMIDATDSVGKGDQFVLDVIEKVNTPKALAINKIDLVAKPNLLPLMARYGRTQQFREIVPISALTGDGVDALLEVLWSLLPTGEPLYDPDLLTVHPERFLAAERIREKVLAFTRDELPFATTVQIDQWEEAESEAEGSDLVKIFASILVERPGQKKIIVGQNGGMIKKIGTAARLDLIEYFQRPVYLELYVRLEPDWRENARILSALDRDLMRSG